ncbi:RagB/SusD family nutrient uptake outer membrane protein [Dyadobacter sp. LHD-138]|uniref:RagB/SusD family nutrient uptake outer membrane protein n=1 Tax=Dyadobacter sp. LHD-138 TaxID=3071413 RepID=UPI0027E1C4A3|nr:RagB/SusD family nutrient uptake outer membrane protein [Dyadobacter sp. LHD-138]MDQ6481689.1 RagB/SusD family nutrient uptake outer membrane protein [Dyadobacter sp. LHD-138]
MRNRISILLLIAMISTSCQDFLKEEMVSGISYEYYNTEKGIESLVWASYAPLRAFGGTESGVRMSNFGTDLWQSTSVSSGNEFHVYTSEIGPANSNFSALWTNFYKGINSCNIAINRIPDIAGESTLRTQEGKNKRLGEVKFLRAYYYFVLVQSFGKAPLLLDENISAIREIKRASVAEIYKAIIADLTFSANYLPAVQPDYARPTQSAAQHLLAKVYLTRGSAVAEDRGQKNTDMDSAAYFAEKVIAFKDGLLADYDAVRGWQNEKNKEALFSVQYSTDRLINGTGSEMGRVYTIQYETVAGLQPSLEYGLPYVRLRPTEYFYDLYNRKNDSRFYKSFNTAWLCNRGDNIPKWTASDAPKPELVGKARFAIGDTALYVSMNPDIPAGQVGGKPYLWLPRNKFTTRLFPQYKYHLDPRKTNVNDQNGTLDFTLMWLGETYLIAAEAHGRNKNYQSAVKFINVVRSRAAYKQGEAKPKQFYLVEGGAFSELTTGTGNKMLITEDKINSFEKLRDFILEERARELGGDNDRWFDLVRTETFLNRVKALNPIAAPLVKSFHKLRPIPQEHIDRIENGGPIAEEQNEGYF